MTTLAVWWKVLKWIFYLILATGVACLVWMVRKAFRKPPPAPSEPPSALETKVVQVEVEALQARVEAKVTADEDKKKVVEILKVDDGAERRKQLAEMLNNL